jgi:hypothetical protein
MRRLGSRAETFTETRSWRVIAGPTAAVKPPGPELAPELAPEPAPEPAEAGFTEGEAAGTLPTGAGAATEGLG